MVIHKCGTKRSDTTRLTLNYEVETWEHVDDWSRTAAVSPRRCTLFLPTHETWPYIDFVVVDPRRDGKKMLVMLYQVTKGTVYDHIKRGSDARVPADLREVGEVHLACLRDRDPTSECRAALVATRHCVRLRATLMPACLVLLWQAHRLHARQRLPAVLCRSSRRWCGAPRA